MDNEKVDTYNFKGFDIPFTTWYIAYVEGDVFKEDINWVTVLLLTVLGIYAFFNYTLVSLVAFYFILLSATFIHELGHYITARLFNVGVQLAWIAAPFTRIVYFPKNRKTATVNYNILAFSWRGISGGAVHYVEGDYISNTTAMKRFMITFAGPLSNFITCIAVWFGICYSVLVLGMDIEENSVYFRFLTAIMIFNLLISIIALFGSDGHQLWNILRGRERLHTINGE